MRMIIILVRALSTNLVRVSQPRQDAVGAAFFPPTSAHSTDSRPMTWIIPSDWTARLLQVIHNRLSFWKMNEKMRRA